MQADRIAREAGSVRGLGVCDVLRAELEPRQRAGLEAALDTRVERLARRRIELERAARARRPRPGLDEELAEVREGLRVLGRLRAALPASPQERFAFAGPAGLVLELVADCVVAAVGRMSRALDGDAVWPRLRAHDLECAAAWIATALDCRAVEGFSFDPGCDPAGAW